MAHILIVDDSPTETFAFKRMLEGAGHATTVACTGEEGIEKAKSERPDLILMDVVMPGMNGFQATRRLSRDPDTSKIPVIMVTTKKQDTDRIWGLRQGARDYVTKPASEIELMGKISELLTG